MSQKRQLDSGADERRAPRTDEPPAPPDPVDESEDESFPASDPPARTPLTGVVDGPPTATR